MTVSTYSYDFDYHVSQQSLILSLSTGPQQGGLRDLGT